MTELYGEQWPLVILISVAITWTWGLTPPLLIRFVLVRRSISKIWAIGTVSVLWVVNFTAFATLNAALDGGTRTHTVWFLVAVASYYILRKGAKDKRSEDPSIQANKNSNDVSYSGTVNKAVKVAKLEVKLGKQKPEILAQARKQSGTDEEYVRLRARDLESQGSDQTAITKSTADSSGEETPTSVHSVKAPPNWIIYTVIVLGGIGLVAIQFPREVKEFYMGFTAPSTRSGCIEKYVHPAKTEIAAGVLMRSCNREHKLRQPVSKRDICLRDGALAALTTEIAARERIRACNQ